MEVVLASNSPRRHEILKTFKIPFTPLDNAFDESSIKRQDSIETYVKKLSEGKAQALLPMIGSNLLLTGDTLVLLENRILLKPKGLGEAYAFLMELSGKTHKVYSAITLTYLGKFYTAYEITEVTIRTLTPQLLKKYFKIVNPLDKAGGYAIQGAGSLIIKSIKGCFYNVMGLPINALFKVFEKAHLNLLDFIDENSTN